MSSHQRRRPNSSRPKSGKPGVRKGRPDRRRQRNSNYRSFAVIHEDDHIMAVAKPDGLLVTMAESGEQTLQDQVRRHTRKSPASDAQLPSAVHRLDRYTSGLVLFGRSKRGLEGLSRLIREGELSKHYYLLTVGEPPETRGRIEIPLQSFESGKKRMRPAPPGDDVADVQDAITEFEVRERFTDQLGQSYALVSASPITGRTHQLRVHFAELGCPIAGDTIYGVKAPNRFLREKAKLFRQFLHARSLEFDHPVSGQHLHLHAKLPKDLAKVLKFLRG